MKEKFEDLKFRPSSLKLIETANNIIGEYLADNLTLTLRQLYYQFVSRGIIPNTQKQYKNLGNIISKARLAGLVDWDAIEDQTRNIRGLRTWYSPSSLISHYSRAYHIDMWENQGTHVEVWIEKDALVGVIDRVCNDNNVDFFACRGYVSQSELYEAGKRMEHHYQDGKHCVIIHLGDHDPSGIDMTRDNRDRVWQFALTDVEVRRIALNFDQIEKYSPPPNPAKMTDSRFGGYVSRFGHESWELDALEPRVMRDPIQSTIDEYKDPDQWKKAGEKLTNHKQVLEDCISRARQLQADLP